MDLTLITYSGTIMSIHVYIYTYMDVYVWVCVCVRGWVAKVGILSSASLKRRQSNQKTFLCLIWREDHTKSCARENLRDRKRLVSLKRRVRHCRSQE